MQVLLKHRLKKIVRRFDEINQKIPSINSGGCGIFAEEAYNLFTNLGYEVKLGIISATPESTKDNVTQFNSITKTPFRHLVLVIDGFLIDSTGVYADFDSMDNYHDSEIVYGLSIELLRFWNREPWIRGNGWNPEFYDNVKSHKILISSIFTKINNIHKPKRIIKYIW